MDMFLSVGPNLLFNLQILKLHDSRSHLKFVKLCFSSCQSYLLTLFHSDSFINR